MPAEPLGTFNGDARAIAGNNELCIASRDTNDRAIKRRAARR
jgi:hypothetical protein